MDKNCHHIPSQVFSNKSNPNTETINLNAANEVAEMQTNDPIPPTPVTPSPMVGSRGVVVRNSKKKIKENFSAKSANKLSAYKPAEIYHEIFKPKLDGTDPLLSENLDGTLSKDVRELTRRRMRMSEISHLRQGETLE